MEKIEQIKSVSKKSNKSVSHGRESSYATACLSKGMNFLIDFDCP